MNRNRIPARQGDQSALIVSPSLLAGRHAPFAAFQSRRSGPLGISDGFRLSAAASSTLGVCFAAARLMNGGTAPSSPCRKGRDSSVEPLARRSRKRAGGKALIKEVIGFGLRQTARGIRFNDNLFYEAQVAGDSTRPGLHHA